VNLRGLLYQRPRGCNASFVAGRDAEHFEQLAALVRMEREEELARTVEEARQLPLAEREKRGHVWLDVEAVEESIGLGGRVLVTVKRSDGRPFLSPLHGGDMVEVKPRRAEDVASATAVVSRATRREAQLAFDRAPPTFVREGRLRLEGVPNDVTYERTLAALARWRGFDRGQDFDHRQRLLGQLPPRFERPVPSPPAAALNPEQREAAEAALAARDFFLVHGPPGTGKSTVLAEVAFQSVARGQRVLCTAASNAAVDHLLDLCVGRGLRTVRVGHPARVAERWLGHTLDVLVESSADRILSRDLFEEALELMGYARRQRTQGRSRERFARARASKAEARQLFDEARALERKAVDAVLGRAQVVCATLAALDGAVLAPEAFDVVLLDEATQATEPLSLIALLRAPVAILAGDHHQLPPTVLSQRAVERGLARSLFERLADEGGEAAHLMLREQYRMNEDIMAFPSREMYGGELRAHPSAARRLLTEVLTPGTPLDAPPVLFLDTAGKGFEEARAEGDPSLSNEGEAELVVARARELLASGLGADALALIAPYSAQAALLRDRLGVEAVEVDTVDSFQGREKEAILLSLTRSNNRGEMGFLSDLRRMNVAMTRAKRHLFIVGDSATLGGHAFYERLIAHVQRLGGYRSAWEWPSSPHI
jgi:ATP-dependent RNA/DNA helicase IGHMBP2